MQCLGSLFVLSAAALAAAAPSPDYGKLPLQFEENRGQTDARVRYLARSAGRTLFLTQDGAVLSAAGEAVRLHWRGANRHAAIEGVERRAGVSNYLGRRPLAGVPQFARVRYREVWPGIDVVFYGSGGELEYDFLVAPGADPRRIRLEFEGAREIRSDGGELVLSTAAGELRQRAPVIYQEGERVRGGYVLRGHQVSFALGEYDRTRALVIDPVLIYTARFGARAQPAIAQPAGLNGFDRGGAAIAVDGAGSVYVAGAAYTADFPTTAGVFQPDLHTSTVPSNFLLPNDAVIMKLNPSGTALVYSTFLGGRGDDYATGIAIDPDGNVYVSGTTNSPDFPTTAGAIQPVAPEANLYKGFVAKINPDASKLLYATYLGSSGGVSEVRGIAIDSARNMYVTGAVLGSNFPTTPGAFRTTGFPFAYTAFVSKINPAGTALVYSTFLGLGMSSIGAAQPPFSNMAIAVDAAGNAYVGGATGDPSFPVTPGAFQTAPRRNGNQPAVTSGFATKVNPSGSDLVFSTYLGGSYYDGIDALALGPDGSIYVTGHASSPDFPTTPGAFMTAPKPEFPPNSVVRYPPYGFVSRLKPDGSGLIYSTYIGGGGSIIMGAIAVDALGNAFVAGAADSTSFPTTPGAIQPCLEDPNGYSNAILFELDPNGSRLLYSTFLGGNVRDQGFALALDNAGNAYLTGMSDSTTFVTTPGTAGIPTGQWFIAKVGLATPAPLGVTCVVNSASMVPGPLAAGEIVSVFGTGLGPANALAGTVVNSAFTTSLGGTRVLFDGVAAPLLMVSGNQINAIVPSAVRFRAQTTMQVEVGGKLMPAQTFDVAFASPAVFTLNGTGTGQAAALNQDGTVNSPNNPAARGSQVTLFANSVGAWQTVMGDGLVLSDAHPMPQVFVNPSINTVSTGVFYLGNSPGSVTALWQLNVLVPNNVFPNTALVVRIPGPNPLTQRVTIAVR
ncbi:MAG: hypothetical protein JWP63_3449 [Candidatus Solibacter sp.]|nr:hypothetical protein [Candidatus Solibacter sp.]